MEEHCVQKVESWKEQELLKKHADFNVSNCEVKFILSYFNLSEHDCAIKWHYVTDNQIFFYAFNGKY